MFDCNCDQIHQRRKIALTGGPGAGKTAVLELVRQYFCRHMELLPEAAGILFGGDPLRRGSSSAGILFGGGFPRRESPQSKKATQRAIFYIQRELERAAEGRAPPSCSATGAPSTGSPTGLAPRISSPRLVPAGESSSPTTTR
jgi:hypothetical protein